MEKNCLNCKDCYKVHDDGYFRHFCLLFKYWLLPDKNGEPTRTPACIELEK